MKKIIFVAAGALFKIDLHGFHKQECEMKSELSRTLALEIKRAAVV